MKKRLSCQLAAFGTALILSALTAFPAFAATCTGHLDAVSSTSISGWAWDSASPNTAVSVELTISGDSGNPTGNTVYTISADQLRDDLHAVLGSASHGFVYSIDWSLFAPGTYTVTASVVSGETKTPLIGTHIYKKEDIPAPSGLATDVPSSQNAETLQPNAALVSTLSTTIEPEPKSSVPAKLTPEQIAMGPGYAKGSVSSYVSPNTKNFGPGSAFYETGEPDQFLGTFHATAYCGCETCSGGHALTYSGTIPRPNHTIAADLDLYPIGTKLLIDGIVYTVEDRGSSVVDQRVDIYFSTHEEALAFGLQTVDVYSVR